MTHLRKMMLEELERRNYAQTTIDCYIQTIEDFARHFRRPPDQLTPEHIREYQAYLFRERKLAASTVTQRLAALRFFYTQTIKKAWSVADTPYPKKTRPLPSILSPEEVAHLIDSLPDSVSSHGIDDALWHGGTARRVGSLANSRYRQPTHGDPHPQWQRSSGPRCHAQSHAAGSLARLLAWAEAQTHGMVIPGRIPAYLQSSHHSPSRVVCVPTCRPAGGPSEPGSSPHAAPLFRYALAGKRS